MKKILMGSIILSMLFVGCSSLDGNKIVKENSISWKSAGEIPAPKGYEKQLGLAAPLFGTIDSYVVVGGGANFPHGTVLEGGPKVYYKDIFLMKETNEKLEVVKHSELPFETAHGSSYTTPEGIYYVGGNLSTGISNKVLLISLKENKKELEINDMGEIPFTLTNGTIVVKDKNIFILPGKENGKDSKNFYRYNTVTKKTEKLANFPGEVRSQSVSQILKVNGKEKMFVFSGMSNITHTDGWAFDFEKNSWTKVADIVINKEKITLAGGTSVKLNSSEMMVIGGVNKEYFDNAVKQLGTLKGDELSKFKQDYFGAEPNDYKFNKVMAIYNAETNSWRTAGDIPFQAPAGAAVVKVGNKIFSINGEIKAGVRSERIYKGEIE